VFVRVRKLTPTYELRTHCNGRLGCGTNPNTFNSYKNRPIVYIPTSQSALTDPSLIY